MSHTMSNDPNLNLIKSFARGQTLRMNFSCWECTLHLKAALPFQNQLSFKVSNRDVIILAMSHA